MDQLADGLVPCLLFDFPLQDPQLQLSAADIALVSIVCHSALGNPDQAVRQLLVTSRIFGGESGQRATGCA